MEKNNENISLLDILMIFIKNIRLLFFVPLISFGIMLLLSVTSIILPPDSNFNVLPNKFKPKVVIILKNPGDAQGGFSSLLSNNNELGSLVNMLGGKTSIGSSDLGALVEVLLDTNEIKDLIINEFKFVEKYKIKKYVKTNTRRIFHKNISIKTDFDSNTVTISYIDTDPVFATNVVNRVVEELEKKVKSLYLEKTNEKKSFLEETIKIKDKELEKMQNELIDYQKKYGIINVASQADKSISYVADLQGNVINKELELKILEKNSPYEKTRIEYLQYELAITKKLIEELKSGGNEYSNEFIPLDKLPILAKEILNLNKDVTIQGLILEMLKQQYEAAKIEESDKSLIFNVIEWAEIPEMKDSPGRTMITIIVVVVAFVISVFIAFIKEYINNIKNDPAENQKWNFIKSTFSFSKLRKIKGSKIN